MYSVDFDRINVDGEKCSDSNPAKDRLIVLPSEPSISKLTNIPEIQNLDLTTIFSGSGLEVGTEVQNSLNKLLETQTFMVGVDLGDRSCGDVETPANTPYLFISPKEDIVISEANKLVAKGGVDNMISMNKEALCLYSRERPAKAAEAVEDTIGTYCSLYLLRSKWSRRVLCSRRVHSLLIFLTPAGSLCLYILILLFSLIMMQTRSRAWPNASPRAPA